MPLKIIKDDIVKIACGAIVNPTNEALIPDGGIDLLIRTLGGVDLDMACKALGTIKTGDAMITPGFSLPCQYVIHTVGPVWQGGHQKEEELLKSCYKRALSIAIENGIDSVAFPLISSGAYGYPKDRVLKVATEVISAFLLENELLVYLVVYDKDDYEVDSRLWDDLSYYIDNIYYGPRITSATLSEPRRSFTEELKCARERRMDCYRRVSDEDIRARRQRMAPSPAEDADECSFDSDDDIFEQLIAPPKSRDVKPTVIGAPPKKSLEDMLRQMDKGFAQTLFDLIDEKGITDVDCYKRSNIDKKTFSKIKCNAAYKPSKVTAVSFAIGLHLSLTQTAHLLNTAGFSLSKSNVFDVIIEYFITSGNYKTIYDVNEVLYKFDQPTLGV